MRLLSPSRFFLVLTFSFSLACVNTVFAADEGRFYVAPGLQWMYFDSTVDFDNEIGPFLGVGYEFNEHWSAELSSFDIESENGLGADVDIDHYKVDLFYEFDFDLGSLDTFVVGGLGNTNMQGGNDTIVDVGAGVQYDFTDRISWRTAVRSYHDLSRSSGDQDIGIDSALIFYFGGRSSSRSGSESPSEPIAAAPTSVPDSDQDRDGVPDSRDDCADTPRTYAVDNKGCPIAVEEVARVELLVNFDFDQSEIKPQYYSEIETVASFMEQYPDTIVELEGHTDNVGSDEYNQDLSERRAAAVRQLMIDQFDVQASRITAKGFGESQALVTNNSSAGRAQNRRVITVIIKTLQNYQPR